MTSLPPPGFVDFETRSRAELTEVGIYNYAAHPSTEVICAVLRMPDGGIVEYVGAEPCAVADELEYWVEGGAAFVAHNAINFDRHIWRKLGWPEPKRFIDTAELAKVAGYPAASLEYLAEALLGEPKDHEGNALTLSLSKPEFYYGTAAMDLTEAKAAWRAAHPKGCGERLPTAQLKAARVRHLDAIGAPAAPIEPATLERVLKYCGKDLSQLVGIFEGFLAQWLDSDLPGLEAADRALNARGICFDQTLARLILDVDAALGEAALERASIADKVEVSPARLKARLAELGVEVDSCEADVLEAARLSLKGSADERHARARLLIEARQACSSIAAGKLRAGLARVSPDGRLRANRAYMGAHTGRWSGKGVQLDNLAKGD